MELDGVTSTWYKQETGIRQGCPLSPYLFLIVMTVLFEDIHDNNSTQDILQRIPNCNVDEILYADDTICISSTARTMNKNLKNIEVEGSKYGMKLNKEKCELLNFGQTWNIHFANGDKVTVKKEVTYLGAIINEKGDMTRELSQRISSCMSTLKKMHMFWRNANCPVKFKLIALHALIGSKLLYSLDTAHLTDTQLKTINGLQFKALRKILKLDHTMINRQNSYENILKKVNDILKNEKSKKSFKAFAEAYKDSKLKRAIRTLKKTDSNVDKIMNFETEGQARIMDNRKQRRPKKQWNEEVLNEIYKRIKNHLPIAQHTDYFDPKKEEHGKWVKLFFEQKDTQTLFNIIFPAPPPLR